MSSCFIVIFSYFHISPWLVCLPSPLPPLFFVFLSSHPHPQSALHALFIALLSCHSSTLTSFSLRPHLTSPLHLVTMQIYLSPLTRKTGSSEAAKSASAVPAHSGPAPTPNRPQAKRGGKPEARKATPSFTLNFQKTSSGQSAPHDTSSYKSPIKSPSQYFQICYWHAGGPQRTRAALFCFTFNVQIGKSVDNLFFPSLLLSVLKPQNKYVKASTNHLKPTNTGFVAIQQLGLISEDRVKALMHS